MDKILADDDCRRIYTEAMQDPNRDQVTVCRVIEAAVLEKLREQEPVAWVAPEFLQEVKEDGGAMFVTLLAKEVECTVPLHAAPLPAVAQVPQDWVLIATEAYEAGFGKGLQAAERGVEIKNPWGDEPGREAWSLGYEMGKQRHKPATPEAPAQAIPAEWREAVKVAREALLHVRDCTYVNDSGRIALSNLYSDEHVDAALAQLDALTKEQP